MSELPAYTPPKVWTWDKAHGGNSPTSIARLPAQPTPLFCRLADSPYVGGNDYSIADIAIWPWYGALVKGQICGESIARTPRCERL